MRPAPNARCPLVRRAALGASCTVALLTLTRVASAGDPPTAAQAAPEARPEVLPAKDADFVKAVNRAVDLADAWLARQQQPDGGYGDFRSHGERNYVAGTTALAALARIAAGENQYSEPLERSYAFLKSHPPKYTYEVGLTLMAFDARCAPVGEWQQVERMSSADLAKYAFPRSLQPGDRDYLQPLVERLVKERSAECWSYGNYGTGFSAHSADMSNTQYAALGLKAASRLGLDFDRKLFADLLDYVLDHQETKGTPVKLIDVEEGKDGKTKEYARKVDARGFGYTYGMRDGAEIAGSRACIAIACIQLSLDELLTKGKGEALARARRRRKEAAVAIDSQLAWLQEHFSVTSNPTGDGGPGFGGPGGPPGRPPGGGQPGGAAGQGAGFLYYYLYAMERVGALTHRKWIGRHDWYREGADELIRRQNADGSFPSASWDDPLCDTCFALLFLKRATLRSSVTSGER